MIVQENGVWCLEDEHEFELFVYTILYSINSNDFYLTSVQCEKSGFD